jgi:hypothetical protein
MQECVTAVRITWNVTHIGDKFEIKRSQGSMYGQISSLPSVMWRHVVWWIYLYMLMHWSKLLPPSWWLIYAEG